MTATRAAKAAATTRLDELPTLTELYDDLDALDKPDRDAAYPPRLDLNDKICIWRGDITRLDVDMIVNAANSSLLGGGGVDGAIHRAAGPGLLAECRTLDGCETGETKVTKGYDLPARFVAHTVGPVYGRRDEAECAERLANCYVTCLQACVDAGCSTIAFPAVSTGVYGYPIGPATRIALETTRRFLEAHDTVAKVVFVVFNDRDERAYERIAQLYFPPGDEGEATASTDQPADPGAGKE